MSDYEADRVTVEAAVAHLRQMGLNSLRWGALLMLVEVAKREGDAAAMDEIVVLAKQYLAAE